MTAELILYSLRSSMLETTILLQPSEIFLRLACSSELQDRCSHRKQRFSDLELAFLQLGDKIRPRENACAMTGEGQNNRPFLLLASALPGYQKGTLPGSSAA